MSLNRDMKNSKYEYFGFNTNIDSKLIFLFVRKNDGVIIVMIEYIKDENGEEPTHYKIIYQDEELNQKKITNSFTSIQELSEFGSKFGNIYGLMKLRELDGYPVHQMFSLGYDEDMFDEVLLDNPRILELMDRTDFLTSIYDDYYILESIKLKLFISHSVIKASLYITY